MKKAFVDLDSIVTNIVSFQFQGKEYDLRPITARAFMEYCNAITEVQELFKSQEITEERVLEVYQGVVGSVCPEFPIENLQDMNRLQIAALLQMILDFTKGRIGDNEDVKKKTLSQ